MDKPQTFQFLNSIRHKFHPYCIIGHGGAVGADSLADEWADYYDFDLIRMPIKKFEWDKYGKAAGHIRNQRMFNRLKPDLGIAFPGENGTAGMVTIMERAGVAVLKPFWPLTGETD